MVDEALKILNSNTIDIKEFGKLLNESWKLKRTLTSQTTTTEIDEIYNTAMRSGAMGRKLFGEGGGAFILLFAEPDVQPSIKEKLKNLLLVPFKFENFGTQIIVYQP
jgi:D-glycero-alpha-D-manno-heptose-7-phosphate kinase